MNNKNRIGKKYIKLEDEDYNLITYVLFHTKSYRDTIRFLRNSRIIYNQQIKLIDESTIRYCLGKSGIRNGMKLSSNFIKKHPNVKLVNLADEFKNHIDDVIEDYKIDNSKIDNKILQDAIYLCS